MGYTFVEIDGREEAWVFSRGLPGPDMMCD